jgi:WD40 repeat protein
VAFDAFISYSSLDKPTADAACATLENAGVRCWIAPRDILPGSEYGASIVNAIESAKIFVLIFSGNANASRQIKLEVERAVSKGITIIPMRIENVLPSKTLEYFISAPHWLDAFTPPMEQHLKQLAASVQALLKIQSSEPAAFDSRGPTQATLTSTVSPPSFADETQRRRRFVLTRSAAVSVLAVLLIAGYLWYEGGQHGAFRTLTGHDPDADSIAFTPDGKWIAAGGWDASIKIWNIADATLLLTIKNFSGHATPFSNDGKWIAGGAGDSDVMVWDAATGRTVYTFSKHTKKVQTVAFSPDGARLVSGGEDTKVYVWNIANDNLERSLIGHTDKVVATAFSPDGKRIVSAGFDGNIMVWDVASGQNIYPPLTSNHSKVTTAVFSPDGGSIATGGFDFNVRVWDADTGQHLRAYPGDSIVNAVAYSPNGKLIAAGYNDGSVNVWDAESVRLVHKFSGHKGIVWGVGFSPDGKFIGSASADKTVKIWKTP